VTCAHFRRSRSLPLSLFPTEGQYLFINCPRLSEAQWHPFTISSAPQEDTVTVHIRVSTPGSWTAALRDYLRAMGPRNASFFPLYRNEKGGVTQGKILGPDGRALLCLDGPHSAPTQVCCFVWLCCVLCMHHKTTPLNNNANSTTSC
jgi:respiratory burst oxidase